MFWIKWSGFKPNPDELFPLTSRENASREKPWPGFIVLHCWLKNATHTLPLFRCRVILYNYALNADGHSKRVDGFSLFLKKKGTISSCRISVYAQPRYGCRTLLPLLLYGIMYTKYTDGQMLIDTYNQHPDLYLVDTRSTLDQQSVTNWPTVNWLISMNRKLVDFRSTVDQGDNGVSIECQVRC